MKKYLVAVLLVATAAYAVQRLELNRSPHLSALTAGLLIGPELTRATDALIEKNKITRSLGASAVIDFAAVTITCEDSASIVVIGARVGDPCFVGPPTTISGAGTGLHSSFTCYVSAADLVKVRHCAAGTADDPASATFFVRVLSPQ